MKKPKKNIKKIQKRQAIFAAVKIIKHKKILQNYIF